MTAIPPNINFEGFKKSMCDGIDGVFKKGVKYGRYLERMENQSIRYRNTSCETEGNRPDTEHAESDTIQVVRCKDCRHCGRSPYGHPTIGWCIIAGHHRRPDYYCADGEKKEG